MKKRVLIFLITAAVFLSIAIPAFASTENIRLVDNADLLYSAEFTDILTELNEVSQRQQVDIIIVTTDFIGSKTPEAYADDYFDYNVYGYGNNRDGILLLISMEDRDWHISTSGYGITAITDDAVEHIGDKMESDLSSGNYAKAFHTYIQLCDEMITSARNGHPYRAPFNFLFALFISLAIGFVIALIVTAVMMGQLKTIRSQYGATDYVVDGSMNVSEARDMFLYRSVSRRPKPQNNGSSSGTHRSSSGRTHGGGGGKF